MRFVTGRFGAGNEENIVRNDRKVSVVKIFFR